MTGAAKRIGREIALALSALGFDIALHYHESLKEARETAQEIKQDGNRCELFPFDLSRENGLREFFRHTAKKFPHLSLLINSASIFEKSRVISSDADSFNRHLNINFKAPLVLSREFARFCRQGQIINILDTHITDNKTAYFDYLLSKKLLTEFTKMAAVEFAPNIRVNAIAPGLILPPKKESNSYLSRLARQIPLKRKGTVDSIAQTVSFLINNDYVTGQIIYVDGGEHLL